MRFLRKLGGVHKRVVHRGAAFRKKGRTAAMPKDWYKRWLWYANPKRFRDFWFTREGKVTALKIFATTGGVAVISVMALFLYFAKDLPTPGQINSKILAQTTRFYDRTGQTLLYEVHGDENRSVVELDKMSPHIRNATVAVEDKNFYKHGAFSSLGIIRAAVNNVLNRNQDRIQGGSTITQQYVKNALLSPERTFSRKIKELILSIQIEQLYNKDDILELYLNEIPYGTQAYGVQAAAKTYFDKDAKDLTVDEAALLAALPRAPSYYSPYGQHVDELITRRDAIINLMREQGYVNEEEAKAAVEADTYAKISATPNLYRNITAPHFVLHAQDVLEEKLGSKQVNEGGLKVITTLDADLQKKAEESVAAGMGVIDRNGGNNAALVAGNPKNGEIMAMVGSRDFKYPGFGSFNAALAKRQPGSSFKPYIYAAGFKTGNWGPGSVMYDVRTDFGGGYVPNNYDNRFHGQMTIRNALANSFNIPAVKMLYIVGLEEAINQAKSMGITTLENPSDYGLSLVLGAGEVKLADHVNGFQSFANGGLHYEQTPILRVEDPKGNVLMEHKNPEGKRVLDPQIAYSITNILSDDAARAITFASSQRHFQIPGGWQVASKTGTTDKARDGWMLQYTTELTAGVWVGHSDNKAMGGITSELTGPIVNGFMRKAHEGKQVTKFEQPAGIKRVTLDSFTGKTPAEGSRRQHNDIFPSWYNPPAAAGPQKATIDKVSQKLATECTPPNARQEVNGQGITAEIPSTDAAFARWNPPVQALAASLGVSGGGTIPTEKDNVHNCSDVKPSVALTATPASNNQIKLSAVVTQGTHALDVLNIKYNGQIISTQPLGGSGTYTTTYDVPGAGSYTFTAEVQDKALYNAESSTSVTYTGSSFIQGLNNGNNGRRRNGGDD